MWLTFAVYARVGGADEKDFVCFPKVSQLQILNILCGTTVLSWKLVVSWWQKTPFQTNMGYYCSLIAEQGEALRTDVENLTLVPPIRNPQSRRIKQFKEIMQSCALTGYLCKLFFFFSHLNLSLLTMGSQTCSIHLMPSIISTWSVFLSLLWSVLKKILFLQIVSCHLHDFCLTEVLLKAVGGSTFQHSNQHCSCQRGG